MVVKNLIHLMIKVEFRECYFLEDKNLSGTMEVSNLYELEFINYERV